MTKNPQKIILPTMVDNIIKTLVDMGLSEYEAKAYLYLLREHPVTAYEAAKGSGIPNSKIYQVLAKLMEKSMVLELIENSKKRYIPQDLEDFSDRFRSKTEQNLAFLEQEARKLTRKQEISYLWNIEGMNNFRETALSLIRKSRSDLLISLWNTELDFFHNLLEKKEKEGLRISLVLFGDSEKTAGTVFPHPIADTLFQEKGGRGFTLVRDGTEALVMTLNDSNITGAWSRNPGFVTMAEDYIKHDIYIMKIVRRFNPLLHETFGENYTMLRDIFNDNDITENKKESDNEDLH